jgi:RNA recognition motif-containing protein
MDLFKVQCGVNKSTRNFNHKMPKDKASKPDKAPKEPSIEPASTEPKKKRDKKAEGVASEPLQMDPKLAALFANAVPAALPPKPLVKPIKPAKEPKEIKEPREVKVDSGEPIIPKKRKNIEPSEVPEPKKPRKDTVKPTMNLPDGEGKKKMRWRDLPDKKEAAAAGKAMRDARKGKSTSTTSPAKTLEVEEPADKPAKEKKDHKEKKEKTKVTYEAPGSSDAEVSSDESEPDSPPSPKPTENPTDKPTSEKKPKPKPEDDPKLPRTLFLGNLPTTVLTRPILKSLKSLLRTFGPISSIRFRSIAFSAPIPKRAAFLSKQLHEKRDSLHAYVVFAEEEQAHRAKEGLDGSVWEGKHLRADMAGAGKKEVDHGKSVFVGNLPFDVADGGFELLVLEKSEADAGCFRRGTVGTLCRRW